MDKIISNLNWDFIGTVLNTIFTIIVPICAFFGVIIIRPWRKLVVDAFHAVQFVNDLKNPDHKMYYKGNVDKVELLHDKHEEQESREVKKLQAELAEYKAREKAKEKEGIEKLQASFESLDSKVENALDKLVDHDRRFEKSDRDTAQIFQLIDETNKGLQKLSENQFKPRRAA